MESQQERLLASPICPESRLLRLRGLPAPVRRPSLLNSSDDLASSKMLFTAIVLALLTGNALCRQQVFSQPPTVCSAKQVITPELSALVERLMEDANVPGMTLGVVHSGGNVEFGAFGRKTEDDDKMTADVGSSYPPEIARGA